MFTDTELAEMQALSESAMPDTFRVVTQDPDRWVDDGMGGGYYAPGGETSTDYACRIGPLGEGTEEARIADQLQEAGAMVLHLPLSATAVGLGTVGTWIRADGSEQGRYAVRGLPKRTYRTHRRLIVAPAGSTAE